MPAARITRTTGFLGFILMIGLVLTGSTAHAICGDVNGDGNKTAVDALAVLQSAVGIDIDLTCSCDATSTTTLPPRTTTTTSTTTTTTLSPIFAGLVTDASDPTTAGNGVGSPWSYTGMFGVAAGNAMCAAIGADHVCTYEEVAAADGRGELASIPVAATFWIHRVSASVIVDETLSPPGPGGRCNDWTAGTDHLVDGEYAEKQEGTITYYFDADTFYDGVSTSHAQPGLPCALVQRGIACCF